MPDDDAVMLVSRWLDDIDTWSLTDPLGWCIGKLLIRNPEIANILREWGGSEDRWRRRMAIMPYIDVCMKGQYRPEYGPMVLEALKPHLSDREFFVGKAVAWALRELSKRDPDIVRRFINDNREIMTKLILREGSRKL